MAVYDKEKERTIEPPHTEADIVPTPGSHDDLGVHPERREAEKGDLEKQFAEPSFGEGADGGETGADESSALDDGGGLYKGSDGESKGSGKAKGKGSSRSKKKIAFAGGGAVLGILSVVVALFGHLGAFQLDTIMKNIEKHSQSRLNASIDARNDYLVRSYVRARLTSVGDPKKGDTLLFRANRVDTNNPFKDWYKTMAASKFEDDLYAKQGIKFTSVVKDGKIGPAIITVRGSPDISQADISRLQKTVDFDKLIAGNVEEFNKLGPDLNKFVDVQMFENHKEARAALKTAVKDNTHVYQVFKRRHMRKDIANMTGIRSWRLFETRREKFAIKKQDIRNNLVNKIADKMFSNNPSTSNIIKCVFSNGDCSANSDPAAEDNKAKDIKDGTPVDPNSEDGKTNAGATTDKDGKKIPADNSAEQKALGPAVSTSATEVIQADASTEASKTAGKLEGKSLSSKLLYGLVSKLTGKSVEDLADNSIPDDPTKIWAIAKRLAGIDHLLSGGKNSSLSKQIKNARRAQLVALFATYTIANDQIKSGDLQGKQLTDFYSTFKGFGNSEGWSTINNESTAGTVSAAAAKNEPKATYCDAKKHAVPTNTKPEDQYAWLCDSQKPNGGSTAGDISTAYDNTIGYVIKPIATVVNAIESTIVGQVADFVTGLVSEVTGAITGPLAQTILGSGIGKSIMARFGQIMLNLVAFLGGGPMYDGSQPGNQVANMMIAGGAATAETSTRDSGGIASTPQSVAFSNQLAAQFQSDQKNSQSLYTRYASLSNNDSLASTAVMSFTSNGSISDAVTHLATALTSLPRIIGSALGGHAIAQKSGSGSALSDWAGVDKYDIPAQCVNLDPLDPNYIDKATNVDTIGLSAKDMGFDTLRDTDKFWAAVNAKIGKNDKAEEIAGKIYNCALLDARVEGSMGYLYGYDKDNGYDSSGASNSSSSPAAAPAGAAGATIVGDPNSESASVQCAAGTKDLGIVDGHGAGNAIKIRLCSIPNIAGTGSESVPGGIYSVPGADGHAIVNSRVSGAYLAMATAAVANGVTLDSASSYRSYAHQVDLYNAYSSGHGNLAAAPGSSNHEAGAAIDFGAGNVTGGSTCDARARAKGNPEWDWLDAHAQDFGFKQFAGESWHWDADQGLSRCGRGQ